MLFLVLSSSACASLMEKQRVDADAAQKRYLLAADYFSKNMIPAAQQEVKTALQLNPRNHEALYLSGLIAMREAAEMEDLAQRAQCLPPAEARVQLEDMSARMRQAAAFFRRSIAVKADYSEAWNALSSVALHFHQYDEALEDANRALSNATYPTPWLALANQGIAYYEKHEPLRAGKVLREALQQDPKFCVARWRLGQVYDAQGDADRARQELEAVRGDKACPVQEAYLLLGRVLEKQNDNEHAEAVFAECRRLAPASCVAKECHLAN